ncbi:MAG: hypothetical protein ACJ8FO_08790 [Sphingomicrobium sp.]
MAITKFLAGGVAIAALAGAAPAAAQYYPGYGSPGYGYGSPYGGNVVGQVLNQVLGGGNGYNGYGNYGGNSQVAVNQCASAVQARLGGGYGGYGNSGGARVLGISRVEQRSNGGLTVRGVASSGHYGNAYGGQSTVDLTWKCKTDYRGLVTGVDVNRAQGNYGYNNSYSNGYAPNNAYDYSQYGYRRY